MEHLSRGQIAGGVLVVDLEINDPISFETEVFCWNFNGDSFGPEVCKCRRCEAAHPIQRGPVAGFHEVNGVLPREDAGEPRPPSTTTDHASVFHSVFHTFWFCCGQIFVKPEVRQVDDRWVIHAGKQRPAVIPAEGVEDGVAVGVADHRVHGKCHAVVGHAGPDGLGHFAQDLGLLRLIPQEKAEGLDRCLQRPGCAGGAEGGGDHGSNQNVKAFFVRHSLLRLRHSGQ